ncbi:MAG: hypothetical protein IH914_11320, partial [candidate division Zixibacteria bacterium]|nr:hypothetical protein [candidate division Zixibacteria bacterium]
MSGKIVALLGDDNNEIANKLKDLLPGELSVVALEPVANDANLLSETISDAETILL